VIQVFGRYLSLVKFAHTVFALPFAAIGFGYAIHFGYQGFTIPLSIKVLLCMVFARSAAMAFNRWADRKIDAANPRTVIREIPSGIIKPGSALGFTIANCLAFITTTWFINSLCFALSFVALGVILGYSFTKRFTALCHFVLGLGLSLAPIGAWIAVTGKFDIFPLLMSAAVFCWVSGFDIIYALQDRSFDAQQGLHSIPVAVGPEKALFISRNLHVASALFLLSAGFHADAEWTYWTGWSIFSGLLIYQHRLVKPHDLSKIDLAFFTTNGIAGTVFALFVLADLFL
jgi:4-hydroxybenzoate polyprenyltransferase